MFWVAVAAALAGGLAGNRTAWVLLGSAAFAVGAGWAGVFYNPVSWVVVDFVVILLILRPGMKITDALIVALFVPVWALYPYVVPDQSRYLLVNFVVIAQLMLTFPWKRAAHSLIRPGNGRNRNFDLRA